MFRVITLQQAHQEIEKQWRHPKKGWIRAEESVGKVLAKDVTARINFPPFDRAAMDGYAVRAEDTFEASEERPVVLRNLGLIKAGEITNRSIYPKTCMRVETGAPMPRKSNAVVPIEFTQEDEVVRVYRSVAVGENVIKKGSRLRKGEKIAEKNQEVSPQLVGAMIAGGVEEVLVFLPPKVGILSTGNELIGLGEKMRKGKIYDINGPMLSCAVKKLGCEAIFLGIAPDRTDILKKKIEEGLKTCDVLLITGGTSAGIGDLLPSSLSPIFHGLAIKPGKPTLFSMLRNKPVFGLPGNPLSAFFVFWELVAPHLMRMCGKQSEPKTVEAVLCQDLVSEKGKEEFIPVKLYREEQELKAKPLRMGSDAITVLRKADGYLDVPLEVERIRAGEKVEVRLFAS